jgi:hypothetical protein
MFVEPVAGWQSGQVTSASTQSKVLVTAFFQFR